MKNFFKICMATMVAAAVVSCNDDEMGTPENPAMGPDILVYGLTTTNQLVAFNGKASSTFTTTQSITGVPTGEKLMSIDFRPATGELYAISDASKLYVVNSKTAVAKQIGTTLTPAISGSIASIDFNPTVDRLRLVTNTGQNLRINPVNPQAGTGPILDGSIPNTSSISGVAYTNSKAGATSTVLYDIDGAAGKLFKQDPPNSGALVEIGNLGMTFTGQVAFDINPDNSVAMMAGTSGTQNNLYTINLNTGKATAVGSLTQKIIDLAIPTDPVAYAIDNANNLQIFNPGAPMPVTKAISGLQTGENILGIDFRPSNGQLFALGSSSRIYSIDLGTNATTMIATPIGSQFSTLISGTDFGFDFNPSVDRIRIVSNTGQNLRVNPVDGTFIADSPINPPPAAIGAAAYTNTFPSNGSTTLYVIDHNTDMLYVQNPNPGSIAPMGNLGINIGSANGFDIGTMSEKAYLMATVGAETRLYTINLANGAATSVGTYPNAIRAFTVGLGF